MRITIARSALSAALDLLTACVDKKITIPILGNVLFTAAAEGLQLVATNQNETLILNDIDATVERPGATTISAALLHSIVRTLSDGPVVIDATETAAVIKSGTYSARLATMTPLDFPQRPEMPAPLVDIPAGMLRELLKQTRYAAHSGALAAHLVPGVFFELDPDPQDKGAAVKLGATDGYRVAMSYRAAPISKPTTKIGAIIPSRSVGALDSLLASVKPDAPVAVCIDDGRFYFDVERRLFVSLRVATEIPNYSKVIPTKHTTIVSLHREEFLLALRRLQAVMTQDRRAAIFEITDTELIASCETPNGRAVDRVNVETQGPGLRISVRLDHTVEFLSLMTNDTMMAGFADAKRAMVLGPVDPGVTCVVASVRMAEEEKVA